MSSIKSHLQKCFCIPDGAMDPTFQVKYISSRFVFNLTEMRIIKQIPCFLRHLVLWKLSPMESGWLWSDLNQWRCRPEEVNIYIFLYDICSWNILSELKPAKPALLSTNANHHQKAETWTFCKNTDKLQCPDLHWLKGPN